MKMTSRYQEIGTRVSLRLGPRGRRISLILLLTICVFFFLAVSKTMCLYFPVLMWLRGDACKIWKDANFTTWGNDYTWWQRACILESDWNEMNYLCTDVRHMGNWPVCFDEPFTPVRKDKSCIVYSFGIAFDFRFDDAMARYNCTVYSFDPSMAVGDYRRSAHVHFKNLGIGAVDNPSFIPRADGYAKATDKWNIMTLGSIMKMLGHTPESISVLKLDVENNEWAILSNLLEVGILPQLSQVLVEWHIFKDSPPHHMFKKMHEDYIQMRNLGFQKFWMRNEGRNHWLPHMKTQAETAYVNMNYKRQAADKRP